MHHRQTTHQTTHRPSRLHRAHRAHGRIRLAALPLLVVVALTACGDDDTETGSSGGTGAPVTTDPAADPATDPAAGGIEPAQACGLLDAAAVDGWLGTSGVTGSTDTSLGLFDGCRWATADTDVPAVLVGYGPTMDFTQVRDMACDGTTPEPAPGAGAEAVVCFGAVVAPAGSGVVLVSVDDPTFGFDDAAQIDIATQAAAAIIGA